MNKHRYIRHFKSYKEVVGFPEKIGNRYYCRNGFPETHDLGRVKYKIYNNMYSISQMLSQRLLRCKGRIFCD